jgi:hypothetical protein
MDRIQNLIWRIQENWIRLTKYALVLLGVCLYIFIVYWIDSVASIELVVTLFPEVL